MSSFIGVPSILIISNIYSRPELSPGNKGIYSMSSAITHPTDQMSIALVYSTFPNISSGAL